MMFSVGTSTKLYLEVTVNNIRIAVKTIKSSEMDKYLQEELKPVFSNDFWIEVYDHFPEVTTTQYLQTLQKHEPKEYKKLIERSKKFVSETNPPVTDNKIKSDLINALYDDDFEEKYYNLLLKHSPETVEELLKKAIIKTLRYLNYI